MSSAAAGSLRPARCPPGGDAHAYVEQLRASAETVLPAPGPVPAASAEESELVLRWLESPGIRLIDIDGEWTCPVAGATRHLAVHDAVESSRRDLVPFDERRDLTPVHRPTR